MGAYYKKQDAKGYRGMYSRTYARDAGSRARYGGSYRDATAAQQANRLADGMYGQGGYFGDLWAGIKRNSGPIIRGGLRGTVQNLHRGKYGAALGGLRGAIIGGITGQGAYKNQLFVDSQSSMTKEIIKKQDGDMLRIQDEEVVATIYGNSMEYQNSAAMAAGNGRVKPVEFYNIDITPGNFEHFPKLASMITNWSEYHMVQCVMIYRTIIPRNYEVNELSYGDVAMATQMNYDAPEWTHVDQLKDHHNSTCGRIEPSGADTFYHGVECDWSKLPGDGHKRIRLGGVLDSQKADYDIGRFKMCVQGTPESLVDKPIGQLSMYYNIILRNQNNVGTKGNDVNQTTYIKDYSGLRYDGTVHAIPLVCADNAEAGLTPTMNCFLPEHCENTRGNKELELLFKEYSETADKTVGSSIGVKIDSYGHPMRGHTNPILELHDFNTLPANAKDQDWPEVLPLYALPQPVSEGAPFPVAPGPTNSKNVPFPVYNDPAGPLHYTAINAFPAVDYPADAGSKWGDYIFSPICIEFPQTLTGNFEIEVCLEGQFKPKWDTSSATHPYHRPFNGATHFGALLVAPSDIGQFPMQETTHEKPDEEAKGADDEGTPLTLISEMSALAALGKNKGGMRHLYPVVCGNVDLNKDILMSGTGSPYGPFGRGDDDARGDLKQTSYRFDVSARRMTYTVHVHLSRATRQQGRNLVLLKIPTGLQVTNEWSSAAADNQKLRDGGMAVYSSSVSVKQYNAHGYLGKSGQQVVNSLNEIIQQYNPDNGKTWV